MSRISSQAKMVRRVLTKYLQACGVKDRVKVRTETRILRSRGESWREYGDASSSMIRQPEGLDLHAMAAECDATVYVIQAADPSRRPLFWLTSEYAKGGRVFVVGGSTARPTFEEVT